MLADVKGKIYPECVLLQTWENFIAAGDLLPWFRGTNQRHATNFAAFQATFSPSFCCAGDQLFLVPWPVFRCLTTAAFLQRHGCLSPLTMRRAKVWQRRRTCCLGHMSCLGAGQALGYRLDPPEVPTRS